MFSLTTATTLFSKEQRLLYRMLSLAASPRMASVVGVHFFLLTSRWGNAREGFPQNIKDSWPYDRSMLDIVLGNNHSLNERSKTSSKVHYIPRLTMVRNILTVIRAEITRNNHGHNRLAVRTASFPSGFTSVFSFH